MARAPARLPPARASALLERHASHRGGAEEQRLLQDQDEGGGNDIARIAAGRIVQRLRQQLDRRGAGQSRVRKAAVGSRAALGDFGADGSARFGDALQRAVVEKEIGRIDISGHSGLVALQHLPFGVLRNVDDREHLPSRQRRMGVGERIGANGDGDRLIGVQGLDKIAAEFGVILVDDRNRDLAQELAEIGLRIEECRRGSGRGRSGRRRRGR